MQTFVNSEIIKERKSAAGHSINNVKHQAKKPGWQLFTSHGLVLISILNQPGRTVLEISRELCLTGRAVSLAISDLVSEGYVVRNRVGRRTFYQVDENHPLKYPVNPNPTGTAPRLTVRALRAENLATHAEHIPAKPVQVIP